MSDKGLIIKDFADALGIPKRTIENYLGGERLPGPEFLTAISARMGVSSTWILTGLGGRYLTDHLNGGISNATAPDFVPIPRYGVEASAGPGALVDSEETTGFYAFNKKWLDRRGLVAANLAVIGVRGTSGEPYLSDGDLILVNRAETQLVDGVTYALRLGNDLVVKSIQRIAATRIALLSANPIFPPREVDMEELDGDMAVIGRVVASMHEW